MTSPNLGLYPNIWNIDSRSVIPFDIFLENVKTGTWQDLIIPIRAQRDKKERDKLKDKLPSVTLSGTFDTRYDDRLVLHSGYIGIDIDDLGTQVNAVKEMLIKDEFTYAVFVSCSGYGLCVIIRIEPDRHRDAYLAIADYYLKKYKQPVDPTGINVSRPRFVSYDPYLHVNENAKQWKKYLPKEKKAAPPPVVFVQNEFDDIVRQMVERGVSCCEDYRDWLRVCFALCHKFGESGRQYFHALSAISAKYTPDVCDKQYTVALKHDKEWHGQKATLSTIYYYAKQAGISIASPTTKKVMGVTASLKKGGQDIPTIMKNLEQFAGISAADSEHIVKQAYDNDIQPDDNDIDALLTWLRSNYNLRHNLVTLRLENSGKSLTDRDLNSIFLQAKKVFDDLNFDMFSRCIFSNNIPEYNPFLDWWQDNKDRSYSGEIDQFWSCIHLQGDAQDYERMVYFGTKWLVGIVSSIYGSPSPLVLVLAGERHGTGKTRVFRRLLPGAWRSPADYYTESKLDGGKDDDILMCNKVLIMDDEFDGKNKKEQKRLKALTDKDTFTIRLPYGRSSQELKRLASLGGTCNELDILNDPTGNRRIIPVHVDYVDYAKMNTIDRDAMWAELFRMYHAGYEWEILGKDIETLGERNDKFIDYSLEYDLINEYFEAAKGPGIGVSELTAGKIKEQLDKYSNQKTNLNKVGQELKRLGYRQHIKKVEGKTSRVYYVHEKKNPAAGIQAAPPPAFPDLEPF
jgi:hypothetical protein